MLNFKPSVKEWQYINEKKFKYHEKEECTWELVSENELRIADMSIVIEKKSNFFRYQTNLKSMEKYFPKSSFNDFLLALKYDYDLPSKFLEYRQHIEKEKKLSKMLKEINNCKVYLSPSKNAYIEINFQEYNIVIDMIREKSKLTTIAKISEQIVYEEVSEIDNPRNLISKNHVAWTNMLKYSLIQDPINKIIKIVKSENIIDPNIKKIMNVLDEWNDYINEVNFLKSVSSVYQFSTFSKLDLLLLRKNGMSFDDPELEYVTPKKFKYVNKSQGLWQITDNELKIGDITISFEEITMSTELVKFEIKNREHESKYFSDNGLGKLLIVLYQKYKLDFYYSLYENVDKEKKLIEYLKFNQCPENVKGIYINGNSFNVKFSSFDIEIHNGLPILRKDGVISDHESHRTLIDLLLNFEI